MVWCEESICISVTGVSLRMSFLFIFQKAVFTKEALATTTMAASVAVTPPSTNRAKVRHPVKCHSDGFSATIIYQYYNYHLFHLTVLSCALFCYNYFFFFDICPFFSIHKSQSFYVYCSLIVALTNRDYSVKRALVWRRISSVQLSTDINC